MTRNTTLLVSTLTELRNSSDSSRGSVHRSSLESGLLPNDTARVPIRCYGGYVTSDPVIFTVWRCSSCFHVIGLFHLSVERRQKKVMSTARNLQLSFRRALPRKFATASSIDGEGQRSVRVSNTSNDFGGMGGLSACCGFVSRCNCNVC
jgi:hypothetical protein